MFPLTPGNPLGKSPASSTRFVLPFAYRLQKMAGHPDAPVFKELVNVEKPNPEPDKQHQTAEEASPVIDENPNLERRKQYLTAETAKVLFERAHWFVLDKMPKELGDKTTLVLRDKRTVDVALNPPRVVLFEYPGESDTNHDVLRTGFLILELYFPKGESPQFGDLLEINELFRYWREPFHGHRQEKSWGKPGSGYQRLLGNWLLPSGDRLKDLDKPDADIYTRRWTGLLTHWLKAGDGAYRKLLIDGIDDRPVKNKKERTVHADDRAYVWTCALIEKGGATLRDTFEAGAEIDATDYGHWIKLLNVDKPGDTPEETHGKRRFERDWAKPLTYRRWEEDYGTFYGFTPHSGAMLASPLAEPPLWQHFGQMYFDQVLLLLYVRTSLFRFSERLTDISSTARDSKDKAKDEKWLESFRKLREEFVWFTNLYQFPLLSNQQQAVEMYGLARKAMDINDLFDEVQREIHGSHEYLSLQSQQRQTEMSALLTVVATMGAIAALAGTYLSLDWIKDKGWIATSGVVSVSFIYVLFFVLIAKPLSRGLEKLYKTCRWFR